MIKVLKEINQRGAKEGEGKLDKLVTESLSKRSRLNPGTNNEKDQLQDARDKRFVYSSSKGKCKHPAAETSSDRPCPEHKEAQFVWSRVNQGKAV